MWLIWGFLDSHIPRQSNLGQNGCLLTAFAWSASSCDSYRFATLVLAPFANLWFVCVEQIFELGDVLKKYFPDLILVLFQHISCFSISSLHTVIMKQHPQSLIPLASQLVKIWNHWL